MKTREEYYSETYHMSVTSGRDKLTVCKDRGDWCRIKMDVNGCATTITVRSQEHLSSLYHMLGDLLGKG